MDQYFRVCFLCREPLGLNVHQVTEHLERKHHLLTSASVLASKMVAAVMYGYRQTWEEVWIILKEFDEKTAAIEHMEMNKRATLQILSQNGNEFEVLNDEVSELKKQLAKSEADLAVLQHLKDVSEIDLRLENSRLRQRLESEKIINGNEMENHQEEIIELKVVNASLNIEMETLRRHASSLTKNFKARENKVQHLNEIETENRKLKDCVQAQQAQLRSVAENIENLKEGVIGERNNLNSKICSLTAELSETNENLEGLRKDKEASNSKCETLQHLYKRLEALNDEKRMENSKLRLEESGKLVEDLNKQILKLKMNVKTRNLSQNNPEQDMKWEVLFTEKSKEIEYMRMVYNEDKKGLEDTLTKKEIEIGELKHEFKQALNQANILNNDLTKHQQNLMEHFQTILKAKQIISSKNKPVAGTDVKLLEEALDSVGKSLVAKNGDCVGQRVLKMSFESKSLQNYLSDRPLSEGNFISEAANNNLKKEEILDLGGLEKGATTKNNIKQIGNNLSELPDDKTCGLCGKHLANASRLKLHMNLHNKVTPFKCDVCKKEFSLPGSLRKHKLIHHGETFKCEYCGYSTVQKGNLKSHCMRNH